MKLRTQILAGNALILALMGVIVVFTYRTIEKRLDTQRWVEHTHEVIAEGRLVTTLLADMETGQRGFLITGKDEFLEPYDAENLAYENLMTKLERLVSDNPAQVVRLQKIGASVDDWQRMAGRPEIQARRDAADMSKVVALIEEGVGKRIMDSFREKMSEFIEVEQDLLAARLKAAEASARKSVYAIALVTLLAALLSIALMLYTSRGVLRRVGGEPQEIAALAAEVAEGNLDVQIEGGTGLRASVGAMLRSLKKHRDHLEGLVDERTTELVRAKEGLDRDIAERKQVEEELKFFKFALDNNADATYWVKSDGRISYVNEAACEKLGYSFEEFVSMKVPDIDPDFPSEVWADHWLEMKEAGIATFEAHHKTKDGHVFPVEIRTTFLEYHGEEYICAHVRDITERKQAEEALRLIVQGTAGVTGEDFFRELIRHFTMAADVHIAFVAELISVKPKIGRTLGIWIGNNLAENFEWQLKDTPCEPVVDGKTARYFENVQTKFPDDEWLSEIEAECYLAIPLKDSSGRVIGHMGLLDKKPMQEAQRIEDILRIFAARAGAELARKRADQELLESKDSLAASQRIAHLGSWDWNIEYNSEKWSDEQFRIFGYQPGEIEPTYQHFLEALHPKDRESVLAGIKEAVDDDVPYDIVFRIIRPDRSERTVHAQGQVYRDSKNKATRMIGTVLDITERLRLESEKALLEEHFHQAQKVESIGRLAGGVAHDLNNLLTPILGYGQILLEEFDSDDSRRESAEEILRAGSRARDLVSQLLAFGRKQTLEYAPVDMNEAVAGFEKLLKRTIPEDIEIEIVATPDIRTIMADIGQIEQVIMNLAINAAEAMPDGGQLTIETAMAELDKDYAAKHQGVEPGEYVMLVVSDTGTGMDDETRQQVFEPFFTTKGTLGTGLGLATVYGIVKQHGGNIWVYSEPGAGATFKVYLPVAEKGRFEDKASKGRTTGLEGAETILLVEDNEPVRQLSHSILQRLGYTVLVAESGAEALTILASHDEPVHLLLTDVVMPGMSGKDLFLEVTENHPEMKVLYMSGYTDNVIARRGVLEEGIAFVQKPFTLGALAAKVREALVRE